MSSVDIEMVCPGCGASVFLEDKCCEYCGRKLSFISTSYKKVHKTTFQDSAKFLKAYQGALANSPKNPSVLASLGFLLLDRGEYKEASEKLYEASHLTNEGDVLFYAALAAYKSKKPFETKTCEAEKILQRIDAALMQKENPQYFYLKAVVIRNLYELRFLKCAESSQDLLQEATKRGLTKADRAQVDALLEI